MRRATKRDKWMAAGLALGIVVLTGLRADWQTGYDYKPFVWYCVDQLSYWRTLLWINRKISWYHCRRCRRRH